MNVLLFLPSIKTTGRENPGGARKTPWNPLKKAGILGVVLERLPRFEGIETL